MMFIFHMAFSIALIALASGVFLYLWSDENDSGLGKVFGVLITIMALLNVACNLYYGIKPMHPPMQNHPQMNGPANDNPAMNQSDHGSGKGGKMSNQGRGR